MRMLACDKTLTKLIKLSTFQWSVGKYYSKLQGTAFNVQHLLLKKDQSCSSRIFSSSSTKHISSLPRRNSGPTTRGKNKTAKRKRGAGQMLRNADVAAKINQSIKQQQQNGESSSAPSAFFILGVLVSFFRSSSCL